MADGEDDWITIRDAAALLRQKCPAPLPVRILRPKLSSDHAGWCSLRDATKTLPNRFQIEICKTVSHGTAIFVLIHEWAHALSWDEDRRHGDRWGKAYARCWRAVFEQ